MPKRIKTPQLNFCASPPLEACVRPTRFGDLPPLPPVVRFIRSELQRHADPGPAAKMQRYIKTAQPFYDVQTPQRKKIFREARKSAPLTCREALK
jgi:hypothetical protein